MAKLSYWNDWRAMARDVKSALSKLSVNQNIAPNEFVYRSWTPEIVAASDMKIQITQIRNAWYWKVREFCFYSARISFLILDTTTNERGNIYLSLPFKGRGGDLSGAVDPRLYESVHSTHMHNVVIGNPVLNQQTNTLFRQEIKLSNCHITPTPSASEWLQIPYEDGVGHYMNWYTSPAYGIIGQLPYELFVSGCYPVDTSQATLLDAVTPRSITPSTLQYSQMNTYTPNMAAGAPMTIASVQSAHARWNRVGDLCHVYLDFDVTTGGAGVSNLITASLPVQASPSCANQIAQCYAITTGPGYHTDGMVVIAASGTVAQFYLHDFANWGAAVGAGNLAFTNFWYETAHL